MAPSLSFLFLGLPVEHPSVREKFPNMTAERMASNLVQLKTECSEAGYHDVRPCFLAPEGGLEPLIEKLKEKKWDGVAIGFGVRGNPDMTVWFEQIVNAVREHSPGTKLLFNTTPPDTIDAMKRNFPL